MKLKNRIFKYLFIFSLTIFIISCARPIATIEERESWGASNFTGEKDSQLGYYYSSFFSYTPDVYFTSAVYFEHSPVSNKKYQHLLSLKGSKEGKHVKFHDTMPLKGIGLYDIDKFGSFRLSEWITYFSGTANMFISHKDNIVSKEEQNQLISIAGLEYFDKTIYFIENSLGMKCSYTGFSEKYQYTDVIGINHFPGSYRRRTQKCADSVNAFLVSVSTILTPKWRYEATGNVAESILFVSSTSANGNGYNSNVMLPDIYEYFKSIAPTESSASILCLICKLRKDPDGTFVAWSKGKEMHIPFTQIYKKHE